MKKILLCICILSLFVGCMNVGAKTGPAYKPWGDGPPMFDAKVTYTDTSAFAPSTSDTVFLECKLPGTFIHVDTDTGMQYVSEVPLKDEKLLEVSMCRKFDKRSHDAGPGAITGFGSSALQSTAIGYAGHKIGEGIGNSGDQTTNTSNSEQSQKQSQSNH